ncbi:MAG: hypothetical protein BGO68_03530 [Candidatus Amoebophilus sp. 36-38]|nr:MAG: hypothetical protein BGO68_03530 [Candidatus Amoebophilus sp. 36-38]
MFLKIIILKIKNLNFYLLFLIFFLESCNENDSIQSRPDNNNLQLLAVDSKPSRQKEKNTNTNTNTHRATKAITRRCPKENPMSVSDYQKDLANKAKKQVSNLITNWLDFSNEDIEDNSARTNFTFPFNDFYFQIWLGDCHRQQAKSVLKNSFFKLYHLQLALEYYNQAASKKHIQIQSEPVH